MLKKYANEPERWLDVDWNDSVTEDNFFPVRLLLTISDKPSVLALLSTAVAKVGSNISSLNTIGKNGTYLEIAMDVDVKNTQHLEDIIAALKALPFVITLKKNK